MPSNNITSITIPNNISVSVPSSPQFMTTFILQEQNDWFEDEIKFIRHFIKPGMKVLDIGANYGLYTLTIADIIGDSGKIWAFEPTETTAAYLKKSISRNKLNNIKLIQSGLSDRIGKAKFFTSQNSELNSLSKGATPGNRHETITLLTLDHCKVKYGWEHIDFIKLDAEGEENNILKKGEKTLTSLSPLIMFELKHGENINLPLIRRFRSMKYDCYRLIPGLNILIPFDDTKPFDGYLLNLFCCKIDRAVLLEREGVIVRYYENKRALNNTVAKEYIEKLTFGGTSKNFTNFTTNAASDGYQDILNAYIMSLSESASGSDRVGYLMYAMSKLHNLISKGERRIYRLATFARIAFDAGERALGVRILSSLISTHGASIDFEISEPFLPASQRYDNVNPDQKINEWLLSSILEQWIVKHAFSSYFSGRTSLPIFKQLSGLGFASEDMQRRHQLVQTCFR